MKRIKRTEGQKPTLVMPSPKKQRPDWFTDAPTTTYILSVLQFNGTEAETVQEVDMPLDHYESLRRHLAALQGWPISEPSQKAL